MLINSQMVNYIYQYIKNEIIYNSKLSGLSHNIKWDVPKLTQSKNRLILKNKRYYHLLLYYSSLLK